MTLSHDPEHSNCKTTSTEQTDSARCPSHDAVGRRVVTDEQVEVVRGLVQRRHTSEVKTTKNRGITNPMSTCGLVPKNIGTRALRHGRSGAVRQ